MCEVYEKSISLWGMAKTFALAGLRLGWLVCKDKTLRDKMASYKDYLTICSSGPSEILSWIALRHKEKIIAANKSKIEANVKRFSSFCDKHNSVFSFTPPRAGLYRVC
jgi:Aspartate/tyrosine/aromatic aminotransferase